MNYILQSCISNLISITKEKKDSDKKVLSSPLRSKLIGRHLLIKYIHREEITIVE